MNLPANRLASGSLSSYGSIGGIALSPCWGSVGFFAGTVSGVRNSPPAALEPREIWRALFPCRNNVRSGLFPRSVAAGEAKREIKKRAKMPVFLNNPDMLKSRFRLPGYWKRTYLSEEAAPGLSLKIINSVKTTVRPVESGEIIMTTFRPG